MNKYQQFIYNNIKLLNPSLKKNLTIGKLVQLFETNPKYYINKNQS